MKPTFRKQPRFTISPLTPQQLASIRPLLHSSSPQPDGLALLDWAIRKLEVALAPTLPTKTR